MKKAKNEQRHRLPPLLVLLAPKRYDKKALKPAKDWVSLKYLDLASALRKAWVDSKSDQHSIGRAWLALYIASIVPGALESDLTQLSEDDVEIYLGQKIPSPKGEPQMKSVVPAASPEVDHYLRHVKIMDQILDDRKNADPSDYEIVEIVYDRAKEKTTELLDDLKKALDSVASRLFRSD